MCLCACAHWVCTNKKVHYLFNAIPTHITGYNLNIIYGRSLERLQMSPGFTGGNITLLKLPLKKLKTNFFLLWHIK